MNSTQQFWSNFRALAGANAASVAVGFALAPALSWLYPPEAFGLLAYFMFTFQLAIAVCTWRFDWLVPNARSTAEEYALLLLASVALVLVCLLLFAGVLGLRALGPGAGSSDLMTWLPLAVMGVGARLLLSARFVRTSDLKPVSMVKVLETLGNAVSSIVFGLMGWTSGGLIGARVVSAWAGIAHLVHKLPPGRSARRLLNTRRLKAVLILRGGVASKATAVSCFNALSVSLPIVVLGWFVSIAELGLYLMTTQLVSTPIRVAANALSQSFWARSAQLARTNAYAEMRREYLGLLRRLGLAAICAIAVLVPASYLLKLVFPPEWAGLDQSIRAFAPMLIGLLTVSATNHLVVLNRVHWQFWADATRLVLMLVSVSLLAGAGAPFWGLVLAVSLSSLAGHAALLLLHLRMYAQVMPVGTSRASGQGSRKDPS